MRDVFDDLELARQIFDQLVVLLEGLQQLLLLLLLLDAGLLEEVRLEHLLLELRRDAVPHLLYTLQYLHVVLYLLEQDLDELLDPVHLLEGRQQQLLDLREGVILEVHLVQHLVQLQPRVHYLFKELLNFWKICIDFFVGV